MSTIAFVLLSEGTITQMMDLERRVAQVLAQCLPGDEVIVPLSGGSARDLRIRLSGVASNTPLVVRVQGPEAPKAQLTPQDVTLRVLPIGAKVGVSVCLSLALRFAQAESLAILSPHDTHDSALYATLRKAMAEGQVEVVVAHGHTALPEAGEHPACILFRREFVRSLLPIPDVAEDLAALLFAWRALLRAQSTISVPDVCVLGFAAAKPKTAQTLFATDSALRALIIAETEHGSIKRRDALDAVRARLFRAVAEYLRLADPEVFWELATACPANIVSEAVEGSCGYDKNGARALAALATEPAWRVVLRWQGARLAGRAPGEKPDPIPAQALKRWRALHRQAIGSFTG